jgi:hypothetical protein
VFRFPDGPHVGQTKAPNMAIRERTASLPSVVFESGWSESLPKLRDDMRKWITGGNGRVKMVILINWRHDGNNRVRGEVEVWILARDGTPRLRETHVCLSLRCSNLLLAYGQLMVPQGSFPAVPGSRTRSGPYQEDDTRGYNWCQSPAKRFAFDAHQLPTQGSRE